MNSAPAAGAHAEEPGLAGHGTRDRGASPGGRERQQAAAEAGHRRGTASERGPRETHGLPCGRRWPCGGGSRMPPAGRASARRATPSAGRIDRFMFSPSGTRSVSTALTPMIGSHRPMSQSSFEIQRTGQGKRPRMAHRRTAEQGAPWRGAEGLSSDGIPGAATGAGTMSRPFEWRRQWRCLIGDRPAARAASRGCRPPPAGDLRGGAQARAGEPTLRDPGEPKCALRAHMRAASAGSAALVKRLLDMLGGRAGGRRENSCPRSHCAAWRWSSCDDVFDALAERLEAERLRRAG